MAVSLEVFGVSALGGEPKDHGLENGIGMGRSMGEGQLLGLRVREGDEGEKEGSSGVDLAAARWLAGVLGSTLVGAHELETWRLASEDDAAACTRLV